MAGINMGNATPGLTRLAAAIGGGPGSAYQNAYDHELKLESSIAQALAAQEASRAQARLHNLQSDELQQQSAARSPDAILGSALTTYGIPQQDAPAVSEYLKTGQLGGKYRMPEDGMGPVAPAPDYAPQLGSVARTIGTMNQALTLGDKNIHNVSQAEEQRRVSGNAQGVLNGTVDPTTFAQSQYAAKGNAPYAFHEFGVGNNLTGAVDATGAPAQNFAQYRQAETQHQQAGARAQVASAANSYASADAHRASAAKTRQEAEQGAKGVLHETDQGLLLVDPRTGTATPVMGPNGQPATKAAPPAKALPGSSAKGYLENLDNLRKAQKALDLIEGKNVGPATGDPDATGWKGYLPNVVLNKADPQGVDARAALSDIGSMVIHDRSGAAVSATEFPRLQPFIPSVRDDKETVTKKLKLFVQNYKAIVDDQGEFYRQSGYNVPSLPNRAPATPKANSPQTAAQPQGGWAYIGKE